MHPNQQMPMHPTPTAPARPINRKRWFDRGVGALVGAFLVGAAWTTTEVVGSVSGPDTFTLRGTMTLTDYEGVVSTTSGGCRGDGGYSDITEGAAVTVYGGSGRVLAVGNLHDSKQVSGGGCQFDIEVSGVPEGQQFYRVEVAHRGKVTFPASEATSGDVTLSLGS